MPIKQIMLIIVVGSGMLISINAVNSLFYLPVSWFLIAQMLVGPLAVLSLIPASFGRYRVRLLVFMCFLAGIAGLLQVSSDFTRFYLYGSSLSHSNARYAFHVVICLLLTGLAAVYYLNLQKANG